MTGSEAEIEAKFYLRHLAGVRQRLLALGARMLAPRILERNTRFDTPDRRLRRAGAVLRLRQDRAVYLTYKLPGPVPEVRQEIEFEAGDFTAAGSFLEALGFERIFSYEKYREVFALEPTHVMLDELPFGCFVEIEGGSLPAVIECSGRLALDWERRLPESYPALFERVRKALELPFVDATFANFTGQPRIQAEDLAVHDATISPAPEGRP